jgi:predicted ATPase
MTILKSFAIEGLWGDGPTVKSNLDEKFNFLIGQNGTGKTTVINLIAAALTGDIEKLERFDFKRIYIVLKESGNRKNPSIEVIKSDSAGRQFSKINYYYKPSSKEEPIDLGVDDYELNSLFSPNNHSMRMARAYRERIELTRNALSQRIKVSWLPLHRSIEDLKSNDERRYLPTVDQKLKDLNNNLVRYFSQLAKRYSDHTLEFQRKSFLSVLTPENFDFIFGFAKSLDMEDERKTLGEIFEVLGVESKQYSPKLKTHFEKLARAVQADRTQSMSADVFAALYNSWRAHSLVDDYKALQKKRAEIFTPRDTFLELINQLFAGRKAVTVSEKNELAMSARGKNIPLEALSSGEKQLLIILGEAVLQNSEPCIYIADEPELSLHILWQELLTTAISRLNKNAQIIFATHSPDIVGEHSECIIDMEKILE